MTRRGPYSDHLGGQEPGGWYRDQAQRREGHIPCGRDRDHVRWDNNRSGWEGHFKVFTQKKQENFIIDRILTPIFLGL